jgi:hypothetical protein
MSASHTVNLRVFAPSGGAITATARVGFTRNANGRVIGVLHTNTSTVTR